MLRKNQQAAEDTIVARATPAGQGGIGIIRVSGPLVSEISKSVVGKLPKPRFAKYSPFYDAHNRIIDEGLVLYFKAPNSFTGEDVLELHGHGGTVVLDTVLQRILELGARLARPGEFSERAFLNGKIDLAQAEAIADLINATSEQAARSAVRSLQGEFSKLIYQLKESLIKLRIECEAFLDFPEEELNLETSKMQTKISAALLALEKIKTQTKQGILLHDGITLVIAGKPNVGKSSLLNILTGEDTAIVTNIPGTTRDVLHAHINIDGLPINIIDTAGLQNSSDIVEQEGIRRAIKEIDHADHILYLVDTDADPNRDPKSILDTANILQKLPQENITFVYNKIDLTNELTRAENKNGFDCIYLSAKTKAGLDLLKQHLKNKVGFKATAESDFGFSARRRHLDALDRATTNLQTANELLSNTIDLVLLAENLHQAQNALNEITGEFTSEDLLQRIFAEFCIGK